MVSTMGYWAPWSIRHIEYVKQFSSQVVGDHSQQQTRYYNTLMEFTCKVITGLIISRLYSTSYYHVTKYLIAERKNMKLCMATLMQSIWGLLVQNCGFNYVCIIM